MSTRAAIIIEHGSSRVVLYRHCDGYLSTTGADLFEKLAPRVARQYTKQPATATPDELLRKLLADHYEKASYQDRPSPIYQLAFERYGDVEHVYTLRFDPNDVLGSIEHEERLGISELRAAKAVELSGDGDLWRRQTFNTYGAEAHNGARMAFGERVNAAIVETNKRLAELRREQPGHDWGPDQELLAIERAPAEVAA